MNVVNCIKSSQKIAFFAGIAGITSLISFPAWAQMNSKSAVFNQYISCNLEVSQNSPSNTDNSAVPSNNSTSDRNFTIQAARDGILEVQLGMLAIQRASSDAVKEFGQRIVEEHTQVNNELAQLASQKGIKLPTDMGYENAQAIARLSDLSGTSFDQAYMQEMVNAHNKAVYLFQVQSQHGQDAELRVWASNIVPNLREHLGMARQMVAERL